MTQPAKLWCGSVAPQLRHAAGCSVPWLSAAETLRLATITAPRRRDQFLAGRWLGRQALAARHGGLPQDWQLSAPADATPQVTGGPIVCSSTLGLSHSGDTVACVLADSALGIDVERHGRRVLDLAGLADLALSDVERMYWLELPVESRQVGFLGWWTLKEAWLKAHGRMLNPATLRGIVALPVRAEAANARLWCEADFTLALVGLDAATPLDLATPSPSSVVQWWQVSEAAA